MVKNTPNAYIIIAQFFRVRLVIYAINQKNATAMENEEYGNTGQRKNRMANKYVLYYWSRPNGEHNHSDLSDEKKFAKEIC